MPEPVVLGTLTWQDVYKYMHKCDWNDELIKLFIPFYWERLTVELKSEVKEYAQDSMAGIASETVEAMMEANNRAADGELKTQETYTNA